MGLSVAELHALETLIRTLPRIADSLERIATALEGEKERE